MAYITTKPCKSPSVIIMNLGSKSFNPFKPQLKNFVHICSLGNPRLIGGIPALDVIHKGNAIHRAKCQAWTSSTLKFSCAASSSNEEISSSSEDGFDSYQGGLLKNAGTIGVATTASKILGLFREAVLAAAFGIGPVITAFNYASILPSFFISLLGGMNGPLHTTITTALSKRSKEDGQRLFKKINATVFLASAFLSIAILVSADTIIDLAAPGLWSSGGKDGQLIRSMATTELKIMTPCILFAGPLGVGFGCLNAAGIYGIPSLSPALSSLAIIFTIAPYFLRFKSDACVSPTSFTGAILLASAASVGALLQWLGQAIAQQKAGFSVLSTTWTNPFMDTDIRELFSVILPAIIGSGMLQIATFTDLYFASFIPGAAASIYYANLLAMAPLGILSSSILLPLLPILSELSKPSLWPRLKERVKQGVLLCMVVTLPLIAVILVLAKPIVEVVFQRFAFDKYATASVSSLLVCYILGSPFYLVRDLLIRVFYALDDGQSPFQISVAAIIMNAFLDWLFILKMGFGTEGLVTATSLVTIISMAILMGLLSNKIGALNLKEWITPCLLLTANCVSSTMVTALVHKGLGILFSYTSLSARSWILQMLLIILSSSMGVLAFFFPLWWLQICGVQIMKILNQRD